MTPSVYRYSNTYDEWHLCASLGRDGCRSLLERHWSTFITRDDLSDIARAGLNAVRIPIGYWAVDAYLLDYEPYTPGQYPYLIQAVQWAREFGISVSIDLHGLPGSQNGQDNSGLSGVIEFTANMTNTDRTLGVLRNLSAEFSRSDYGGVVKAIELANEPRLTGDFTMTRLKAYYTSASQAVRDASGGSLSVTMHDAFWSPSYWASYDPLSTSTSTPASYAIIDTHQYYAFPPYGNLPQDAILGMVCNMSKLLKGGIVGRDSRGQEVQTLPRTVVGEWSLESGSGHSAAASERPSSQEKRTWLRKLFEAQVAAYIPNGDGQPGQGFYYWSWKTEYEIDTWSYRRGLLDGFIPLDVSNASTFAFPLRQDGCIDDQYDYQAPNRPYGSPFSAGGRRSGEIAPRARCAVGIGIGLAGCLLVI